MATRGDIGLLGLGTYLPERIMTNHDWAARLDTSDDWIVSRTGIERRHIAGPDETTLSLALAAARAALADARLEPAQIGEVIVATDTPEVRSPDTAAFVQHGLGLGNVPAYDLGGSGCAGFLQAIDISRARITVAPKRVLVIGVELLSRVIDWQDRSTVVLFGDGAGATVVGPGAGLRIVEMLSGTDGKYGDALGLQVGGTRVPFSLRVAEANEHCRVSMNGRLVFREAVCRMSQAALDVLAKAGLDLDDIDLFIPHQANLRIIDAIAKRLELGRDRVFVHIDKRGNLGSAALPVALCEARAQRRLAPRSKILLVAFGAGFHWSAAILEVGEAPELHA